MNMNEDSILIEIPKFRCIDNQNNASSPKASNAQLKAFFDQRSREWLKGKILANLIIQFHLIRLNNKGMLKRSQLELLVKIVLNIHLMMPLKPLHSKRGMFI